MAGSVSYSSTPSVPTNWLGGLSALLAAFVMASLWLNYGTTPALFAAVGVAIYAAIGPLQLATLVFSRRTAILSCKWGVYFVGAIIVIDLVGYATDSPDVVLSTLASLAFICGLALVGVFVLRAIWRAMIRTSAKMPGVWSSAVANLQSQITLLYLYSGPDADADIGARVQGSLNTKFDPH